MGKPSEDHHHHSLSLPTATADSRSPEQTACPNRCRFCEFIKFKCVFVLLLGASVLLSALFLLPPFLNNLDRRDLDLSSRIRSYEIVASFMLEKPVSLLQDNIYKLEDDIFTEIEAPTTKVKIFSLVPQGGENITKVYFAIVPYDKHSRISSTGRSLIRASFESLIIRQSVLRLTVSLFGDPFTFEVQKFPGGITIIPPQGVFLLQKVQILFNFTLIASIERTQDNFNALRRQLKLGLHLASYENLYIKLTNPRGSTVASPTTVQAAVVLAIGNIPSQARLKQLAQTITDPDAKNLGLNNSVFGKVKQVRLSSILQHTLGGVASPTPAPSPLPYSHHYHHHHHHHHHHHYHHAEAHLAPIVAPAPSPTTVFHSPKTEGISTPASAPVPMPMRGHKANPPGCQFQYPGRHKKGNKQYHLVPPVEPPELSRHIAPSPLQQINPPAYLSPSIPTVSPLPHPVNAHLQPPSQSESDRSPLVTTPSESPLPSSSFAGLHLPPPSWVFLQFIVLFLLL